MGGAVDGGEEAYAPSRTFLSTRSAYDSLLIGPFFLGSSGAALFPGDEDEDAYAPSLIFLSTRSSYDSLGGAVPLV